MNANKISLESDIEFTELNIDLEKPFLLAEIAAWFQKITEHIRVLPHELDEQVELLSAIRRELYEDLNQLQHAALIIKAAEALKIEYPKIDSWYWHPKQTSHPDYADLTGYVNEKIFLNAEVTTSLRPVGTIDKRMRTTLVSLNDKEGLRFYFVVSNSMFLRANSKVENNNFEIIVRQI